MSNTTPDRYELQAGLATFANVDPRHPNEDLMHAVGTLSVKGAMLDLYHDWHERVGSKTRTEIAAKADLARAFEQFAPFVGESEAAVEGTSRLLGVGGESTAYAVTIDGHEYAVRYALPEDASGYSPAASAHTYADMYRARGVPGTEQIMAVSYDHGITVSKVMPGQTSIQLDEQDITHVTDEQIHAFFDNMDALRARGIGPDPTIKNVLYDPQEGIGAVDLGCGYANKRSAVRAAISLCNPQLRDEYAITGRECDARDALLRRILAISTARYGGGRDVDGWSIGDGVHVDANHVRKQIAKARRRAQAWSSDLPAASKEMSATDPSPIAGVTIGEYRAMLWTSFEHATTLAGQVVDTLQQVDRNAHQATEILAGTSSPDAWTMIASLGNALLQLSATHSHLLVAVDQLFAYRQDI